MLLFTIGWALCSSAETGRRAGNDSITRPQPSDLSQATYAGTAKIGRHLRASSLAEVQKLVGEAAQSGRKLYPISTGKNWGYGSATPSEAADILDLGGMVRFSSTIAISASRLSNPV